MTTSTLPLVRVRVGTTLLDLPALTPYRFVAHAEELGLPDEALLRVALRPGVDWTGESPRLWLKGFVCLTAEQSPTGETGWVAAEVEPVWQALLRVQGPPPPDSSRAHAFAADLSRLLFLRGFDEVQVVIGPDEVTIQAIRRDLKGAKGSKHKVLRSEIDKGFATAENEADLLVEACR